MGPSTFVCMFACEQTCCVQRQDGTGLGGQPDVWASVWIQTQWEDQVAGPTMQGKVVACVVCS